MPAALAAIYHSRDKAGRQNPTGVMNIPYSTLLAYHSGRPSQEDGDRKGKKIENRPFHMHPARWRGPRARRRKGSTMISAPNARVLQISYTFKLPPSLPSSIHPPSGTFSSVFQVISYPNSATLIPPRAVLLAALYAPKTQSLQENLFPFRWSGQEDCGNVVV